MPFAVLPQPVFVFPDELLPTLLAGPLLAVCLLRPVSAEEADDPERRDFTIEYLNPAGQRLLSLPEQPGGTVRAHLPSAQADDLLAFCRRVYATGEAECHELCPAPGLHNAHQVAAQRHGSRLLLTFTGPPPAPAGGARAAGPAWHDETGNLSALAAADPARRLHQELEVRFAARTQELRQAHADAEERRQRLHALFEQAPMAITVLRGPRYVIELANPVVCALWGRTPAQALGTPLFELLPEAAGQGFEQVLDGVMTTGQPHVARETPTLIDRAGHRDTVYWNYVFQPLRAADGQVAGVTVLATEVSEQVAARQQVLALNEELRASNEQLRRSNRDLDNFIYTASHDLKTPIGNIEGLVAALQHELPLAVRQLDHVQPMLDMMQAAVQRFQLTLTQLTDITALQQSTPQLAKTVDLAALVEAVRLDLTPQLAATGGRLVVEVAACPMSSISAKNMRSIVFNLLSNALKYCHPDRAPEVRLSCHGTGASTVLEVQDNGLGLDKNQQTKLFGMFVRLHDHVEGSGIGLFMVKRIVENAGGSISVQSQVGQGSTFSVCFPS